MGDAVAAYYRSQFLNVTLPGGVVGDVHRAVRHGVDIGDVGLGVRAAVLGPVRRAGRPDRHRARRRWPRWWRRSPVAFGDAAGRPRGARGGRPRRGRRVGAASSGRRPVAMGPAAAAGPHRPAGRAVRRAPVGRRGGSLHSGRGRPGGHLPAGRPHRRVHRAVAAAGPAGAAGAAGHGGAAELRRLGSAGGRGGLGIRRGRARLPRRASPPPSRTACWCSSRACRAPWCCSSRGSSAGPQHRPPYDRRSGRARRTRPRSGVVCMGERPYVLLSCGMSIDGYLGGATEQRLLLSNDADFDRVDAVRADCDAILVGATTVRRDNPRLLVRSPARREARVARGLPPSPVKVTVTRRGQLDPCAQFFTAGEAEKIVYCASAGRARRASGSAPWRPWSTRGQPVDFAPPDRGPVRPRGRSVDGRGRGQRAHPVPDRRARRRAAPGGGPVLRRRLAGPPVRRTTAGSRGTRTAGPRWPTCARSATWCCCGTRCRIGSAPAHADRPGRRSKDVRTAAHGQRPHAGVGAVALLRRLRHHRRRVLLHRPGRRSRAPRLRPRRLGRRRAPWRPRPGAAGAPAQRVPHRRRLRQPALRLRSAAARGGRAGRRLRGLPALPAPGGSRHRPVRQARGVRAAGRRAGHLRGERRPRPRRGRAGLHRRRPDAARPRRGPGGAAEQQPGQGASSCADSGSRSPSWVPTGVHLSPSNAGYLATKARRAAHTISLPTVRHS